MALTYAARLQGIAGSVAIKAPVRLATTVHVVLSGEQDIDGVSAVSGDRVLVKNQSSSIDNGIYIVGAGTWARATDMNDTRDVVQGSEVRVNEGVTYAGVKFIQTTGSPAVGSTDLTFTAEAVAEYISTNDAAIKLPVRAATTGNITLSGTKTIDGIGLVSGDRVLVKDQSTASQNGVYLVSTGAWQRAGDFDEDSEVRWGTEVFVLEGAKNGLTRFYQTETAPTVGSSDIGFNTQRSNLRTRAEFVEYAATGFAQVGDEVTAQGLSYRFIDSGTAIADAPGWVPSGAIHVQHFAENTTPGTTDTTAAVEAAAAYVHGLNTITASYGFAVPVSLGGEICALDGASGGVDLSEKGGYEFYNGTFLATGSWSDADTEAVVAAGRFDVGRKYTIKTVGTTDFTAIGASANTIGVTFTATGGGSGSGDAYLRGKYMFHLTDGDGGTRPRYANFNGLLIECDHKAGGILYCLSDDCKIRDTVIHGQDDAGVISVTQNGAFDLTRVHIKQFSSGETNWDSEAARNADGFVLNTADFKLTDCTANYCRYPLYKNGGSNCQINGFHPFNGGLSGTPSGQIYNIYLENANGAVFTNTYLDKGCVFINGDNSKVKFLGGKLIADENDVYFEIEARSSNTDLAGLTIADFYCSQTLTNAIHLTNDGSGTFASQLLWTVHGNQNANGSPINIVMDGVGSYDPPSIQFGDRFMVNRSGDVVIGGDIDMDGEFVNPLLAPGISFDDGTNTLDLFETSTWTITFEDESANVSPTTATGVYFRVQNGVQVIFPSISGIDITGMTGAEDFRIKLPFSHRAVHRSPLFIGLANMASVTGTGTNLMLRVDPGDDFGRIVNYGAPTGSASIQTCTNMSGATISACGGWYAAAAV